jgi:hypothetical protein
MAAAVEAEVKDALKGFEAQILGAVRRAWSDDWMKSPHRAQIRYPRTRANLMYDFMVHRAIAAFDGNRDVHVIHQDETAKFLFRQKVLVRLKKGDENFLGSNIGTQAVLAFTDPQASIPGLPDVQKVDVVYILNDLKTAVDRVVVTARDNDIRVWSYDLDDGKVPVILPLPVPSVPPEGDKIVRLRSRAALQSQGSEK